MMKPSGLSIYAQVNHMAAHFFSSFPAASSILWLNGSKHHLAACPILFIGFPRSIVQSIVGRIALMCISSFN